MSMNPGDFYTVGLLDISKQDRENKVIKLGFDFDSHPVCFITTDIPGDSSALLTVNDQYDLKAQEQKRAVEIYKESHQRDPFDKLD